MSFQSESPLQAFKNIRASFALRAEVHRLAFPRLFYFQVFNMLFPGNNMVDFIQFRFQKTVPINISRNMAVLVGAFRTESKALVQRDKLRDINLHHKIRGALREVYNKLS
jgi:hypothetical protein